MEVYATENNQITLIGKFFKKSWKALLISFLIGMATLAAWRYWQIYQHNRMTMTATEYEEVISGLATSKIEGLSAAEKFVQKNKNNYGVFVSLVLAQHAIENREFDKALHRLTLTQTNCKDANLLAAIKLGRARLHVQLQQPDDALKILDSLLKMEGWSGIAHSIRGDALLTKGQSSDARAAYNQAAIKLNNTDSLQSVLRLKLDNLPD